MAATGYTPISLYYSTTASATPTAGNLVAGELALNTTDEKLYFKNASGTVKLLAANITPVANGGTGLSSTPSNGQLDIGNGTGFTRATLTAGSGISITNGSGSITIANTATVAAATPTALGTVYAKTNNATAFETFLGYQAGNVSTGTYPTFVGYQAGLTNSTGAYNTALGYQALQANTTGGTNTAIGAQALFSNTGINGGSNVAVGGQAMYSNTSGQSNTAVGTSALWSHLSGYSNTAVGGGAGFGVTTGNNNTLIGTNAGFSGTNNLTTGSNNIIIGAETSATSAGATNEITIGNASITRFRVPGLSINWTVDLVPFRNIPQNAQTGSYTLVSSDSGKHIYHASGAGAATYTIPANSSVAYPIGTAVTFINLSSTSISIAITTDTMYLSSAGTTGTRTLAQYGSATAIKVDTTTWMISGSGLT